MTKWKRESHEVTVVFVEKNCDEYSNTDFIPTPTPWNKDIFPFFGRLSHLLLSCQLIDAFKKMVFEFNIVFLPLFSGRICPYTIAHLF